MQQGEVVALEDRESIAGPAEGEALGGSVLLHRALVLPVVPAVCS